MEQQNKVETISSQKMQLMEPIATPKQLLAFQSSIRKWIKEGLTAGIDYGPIPGTKKEVLLKPGAEKLGKAYGLRPRYTQIQSEADHNYEVQWRKRKKIWNNAHKSDRTFHYETEEGDSLGLYRYVYKCELIDQNGNSVAEAFGSCSSMESKYIENPRDVENTVLKMAQKRARVAATIEAFGLSEAFTQDFHDDEDEDEIYEETDAQKKKLAAIAKSAGFKADTEDNFRAGLKEISMHVKGTAMGLLEKKIRDYIENPLQ